MLSYQVDEGGTLFEIIQYADNERPDIREAVNKINPNAVLPERWPDKNDSGHAAVAMYMGAHG